MTQHSRSAGLRLRSSVVSARSTSGQVRRASSSPMRATATTEGSVIQGHARRGENLPSTRTKVTWTRTPSRLRRPPRRSAGGRARSGSPDCPVNPVARVTAPGAETNVPPRVLIMARTTSRVNGRPVLPGRVDVGLEWRTAPPERIKLVLLRGCRDEDSRAPTSVRQPLRSGGRRRRGPDKSTTVRTGTAACLPVPARLYLPTAASEAETDGWWTHGLPPVEVGGEGRSPRARGRPSQA